MPQEIELNFNYPEDEGLNLTGTVNFPNTTDIGGVTSLKIRGLAEWRHVPANVVHVNEEFIRNFQMVERSKGLSKVGLNWIGIQAHSDILLSFAVRHGKTGTQKVQEQLTKFFKTIGASSVKFSVLSPETAFEEQEVDNEIDIDNN